MDRKIKLFAVASIVAVMASGCSAYRGASQRTSGSEGYSSGGGYGQSAGSGQIAGRPSLFGQQRRSASATCSPCGTNKPQTQSTYTYKPAKPAAPQARAGEHSQQWYIDRWNRQQKQQGGGNANYTGYGTGTNASNTTYYDYSSAGRTDTPAPTGNVSASNKSIYTGSYQQKTYKPYQPTTYSGGSSATTNTAVSATTAGTTGGSTYMVKKGDTVFEIMRQTGVYWKDIISVNNLQPPYNISPGQTIRLK